MVSANDIIIEVAESLLNETQGSAKVALSLFVQNYANVQASRLMTVFLACFSLARDDGRQWREYGDSGQGVCLGLRTLDESPPTWSDRGSALIKIDYSEQSWRSAMTESFREVCALLQTVESTKRNIGRGLSALYRIAAFGSIRAKRDKWSAEQEYRNATVIHKDAKVEPGERVANGKTIRYLATVIRADGKRMALAEITIGPNQDAAVARHRIEQLLSEVGYQPSDPDYPIVIVSSAVSTDSKSITSKNV